MTSNTTGLFFIMITAIVALILMSQFFSDSLSTGMFLSVIVLAGAFFLFKE